MDKMKLEFNPDFNTVRVVKDCQRTLRDLIRRRCQISEMVAADEISAEQGMLMFLNSFDTLTQGYEVSK